MTTKATQDKSTESEISRTQSSLISQIRKNSGRNTYQYTFYTCNGEFTGRVREIGLNYVAIRKSSGYREHTDIFIAMDNVCAIREHYSSE